MPRLPKACALLLAAIVNAQDLRAQPDLASFRSILKERYAQQDSAIALRDLPLFLSTLARSYEVELRDGRRFARPGIDSAIARDMRLTRAVTLATTSCRLRLDGAGHPVGHSRTPYRSDTGG